MSDKIGIIAWGTKRGKQVFFHSKHLNPKEQPIERTLEDIQGIINFNSVGSDFYSLEFTDVYKVYTAYRSVYDWTNRKAYFAISLLVPHSVQILQGGPFGLINDLMAIYIREYVQDNQITTKKEDPELFERIIRDFPKSSMHAEDVLVADTNNLSPYAFLRYPDPPTLGEYFKDPYRKEFRDFKEVFFIPEQDAGLRAGVGIKDLTNLVPPLIHRYAIDFQLIDEDGKRVQEESLKGRVNKSGLPRNQFPIQKLTEEDEIEVVPFETSSARFGGFKAPIRDFVLKYGRSKQLNTHGVNLCLIPLSWKKFKAKITVSDGRKSIQAYSYDYTIRKNGIVVKQEKNQAKDKGEIEISGLTAATDLEVMIFKQGYRSNKVNFPGRYFQGNEGAAISQTVSLELKPPPPPVERPEKSTTAGTSSASRTQGNSRGAGGKTGGRTGNFGRPSSTKTSPQRTDFWGLLEKNQRLIIGIGLALIVLLFAVFMIKLISGNKQTPTTPNAINPVDSSLNLVPPTPEELAESARLDSLRRLDSIYSNRLYHPDLIQQELDRKRAHNSWSFFALDTLYRALNDEDYNRLYKRYQASLNALDTLTLREQDYMNKMNGLKDLENVIYRFRVLKNQYDDRKINKLQFKTRGNIQYNECREKLATYQSLLNREQIAYFRGRINRYRNYLPK